MKGQKLQNRSFDARIYVAVFGLLLFAAVIILRILFIQVWQAGRYSKMADRQYILEIPLEARRGLIYDRHMEYLVLNESCVSIGLDKRQMSGTAAEYARGIASVVKVDPTFLTRRINSVKSNFVWLLRRVDFEYGPKIRTLNLPGIIVEKDSRRIYPHQEVASHILGFTNVDNAGIEGVELSFNETLTGRNGSLVIQRDGRGNPVPEITVSRVEPQDGKSIVLTIDYIMQTIATEELRNAVREFNARNGTVIICNPQTGEILAIANEPSYNPNHLGRSSPSARRNRALTDLFEPGSTFKLATFSTILESNAKSIADLVFCENGTYNKNGRIIRDTKKQAWLTVADVLKLSSNIGTIKLAEEVGGGAFYRTVEKLGFGARTGIPLPGEAPGLLRAPRDWSNYTLASMAIGQEVSVTALQMTMAYAAIANGGTLLKPRLLLGQLDEKNRLQRLKQDEEGTRVISPETAATMRGLLKRVVEEGTGEPARIPGLSVAGKTGTAQKALANGRGYSDSEFIANFVGFFPAEEPKYLIYVVLDTDRQNQWGRYAAATFKRIAERIRVQEKRLLSSGIPAPTKSAQPQAPESEASPVLNAVVLPDFTHRRADQGRLALEAIGLTVVAEGTGSTIVTQEPPPGAQVPAGSVVRLTLANTEIPDGVIKMPNVVGLSLRVALHRLAQHNLDPMVYGHGRVVRQKPEPGTPIKAGARCIVECSVPAVQLPAHASVSLE